MLKYCSIGSGSSGNCHYIGYKDTNILVDAGLSGKRITTGLDDINVDMENIKGIFITHEHSDHVQGLGTFAKKFNVPVFVNSKTLDNMPKQKDKIPQNIIKNFAIGDTFEINDLKIKSFAIPHDAVNPCGFNISNNEKNISIATDIGHMTKEILKVLEPSDFVLLESNYDPEVLKCSPYPYILKSRIAGPNGHLPNELAGKTIAYLLKCNLKTAMLGHLSKESNFPELAYKTVLDEVIAGNCKEDSLNLSVASRDIPGKLIKI